MSNFWKLFGSSDEDDLLPANLTKDEALVLVWWSTVPFCGCVEPMETLTTIRKFLRLIGDYKTPYEQFPCHTPEQKLVLILLDQWGLVTHGGTYVAPFLTAKGEQLLEGLNSVLREVS